MDRFGDCKYNFKLTLLWRNLEFYTRVHKKGSLFCCSLNHKIHHTYKTYVHIAILLALCAQHRRHYNLIFSRNNTFFLIPTLWPLSINWVELFQGKELLCGEVYFLPLSSQEFLEFLLIKLVRVNDWFNLEATL